MWKTTFVASGYICFASYICSANYILTLSKLYFGLRQSYISADAEVAAFIHNLPTGQISLQRNITAVGNITA